MLTNNEQDPFYRYKLEAVRFDNVRGNWTRVQNFDKLAQQTNFDAKYIAQFFKIELGCNSKTDGQQNYLFNGNFNQSQLNQILDKFTKVFVMCPVCSVPETELTVENKKKLLFSCKACGKSGVLKTNHPLKEFLLRNSAQTKIHVSKEKRTEENNLNTSTFFSYTFSCSKRETKYSCVPACVCTVRTQRRRPKHKYTKTSVWC